MTPNGAAQKLDPAAEAAKVVLHVGCGQYNPEKLPEEFRQGWQEIRLDISPNVFPDIVADITDMPEVETASVDAPYSSHNVEHLWPHDVPKAFAEFFRVLKPGGFALVTCPDTQAIAALVADDKLEDAAYSSKSGPITPLDMLYGFRPSLAAGEHYMAHRTGFTARTLAQKLLTAGFRPVTLSKGATFDLWARAQKPSPNRMRILS